MSTKTLPRKINAEERAFAAKAIISSLCFHINIPEIVYPSINRSYYEILRLYYLIAIIKIRYLDNLGYQIHKEIHMKDQEQILVLLINDHSIFKRAFFVPDFRDSSFSWNKL